MNLDDLTIGQAKSLAEMFRCSVEKRSNCPYESAGLVGKEVMVRTVTMIYIGKLLAVGELELTLSNVVWIPETGRWSQFIADGDINECEPYPVSMAVLIGRGSIIDVCEWISKIPGTQK